MNQPKLTGGRLISAPLGGTKQKCEAPFDEPAGRRALKPLYPTDLNNNNIGAKRAPNQKPIRYRVTGTPRVDRMSSSPQPNTMLPHINAAFKANAPSSTPAGPTAPISMQPVYDRRNPYAPLADAPEDPPTITTGTGAGASGSSIEFPPLRKRVRDPAATCSSSAPTSPAKTPKSKKPGEFIFIFIWAIRMTMSDDVLFLYSYGQLY
tara:strand:+ start:1417 stop:2037 length:621 start_codon:yes stop_codon:yes gene_type:complete